MTRLPRGEIPKDNGIEYPEYWAVPIMGGKKSYSSFGRMIIEPNVGGRDKFFRIEFRLLDRFWETPSVSVQVTSVLPHQPHMAFTVNVNDDVTGMTQIAIYSITADRKPCSEDDAPYCNIVVIGRPREKVKRLPTRKPTKK